MSDERQILAVFIDFENLAIGLKNRDDQFDIHRVLARLVEKGNIVVKRAYASWSRFAAYSGPMHESAIELIEIPRRMMTGKNSADMRLCVDAMDLCYSKEHINTFVILSGDSDFSPLVSKLKENGKRVIGLGMQGSTSELLRDNCDEFIYYEDLEAESAESHETIAFADDREKEVFGLLLESLQALRRENRDTLWSSMIKETMKRKRPSFNEATYGFKSFSKLLEAAAERGVIEIRRDSADRSYIVSRFGAEMEQAPKTKSAPAARSKSSSAERSKPASAERSKPNGERNTRRRRVRKKTTGTTAEMSEHPEKMEKSTNETEDAETLVANRYEDETSF